MNLKCPLCGHEQTRVIESLTGRQLSVLWREHGDEFSAEAFLPITPETEVALHRCAGCGFEFFDGALSGSARFYDELSRGTYYARKTPEFLRALRFARQEKVERILDVGCGEGDFMDLAKAEGRRTYGIELSAKAAAIARAKGHRVFDQPIQALSPEAMDGEFDLVTLFQVLEHVAKPESFISEVKRFVRPGGHLIVGVPFAGGIQALAGLVPHQWPPHHISRWRHAHLRRLGERAGLGVIYQTADVLEAANLRYYLRLNKRMARALGRTGPSIPEAAILAASVLYSVLGMKYFLPGLGTSAFTVYRK
jgi:SAM-dependent methyltransferase